MLRYSNMADSFEVKCIKKTSRTDPHERIHVFDGVSGTTRGYLPLNDAIAGVETGKNGNH